MNIGLGSVSPDGSSKPVFLLIRRESSLSGSIDLGSLIVLGFGKNFDKRFVCLSFSVFLL